LPSGIAFAAEPVAVQARAQKLPKRTGLEKSALTFEASFVLSSSHQDFGGLSGIWLADDGNRMIAVSDRGQLWQARLQHGELGKLVDVDRWTLAEIPKLPNDPKGWRSVDAEALAGDDRSLVVAYEGYHRLRRLSHSNLEALPQRLPRLEGLGGPSNSGIESLASLNGGRFLAIAEGVGAVGGAGLSAWLIDGDQVDDLVYVPSPGFVPTGADRLDETLFVIERQFSLLGGFRSRLMTVPVDHVRPGAHLNGRELAVFRFGDIGENFEAVAAKRAPDGRTLIYLLSDDNFSIFQRTVLLQLSLPETAHFSAGKTIN